MKNKREIIESKYPPVNNEDLWLKDGKLYHSTSQGWVPLSEEPSITETYEQGVSSISYSGKDGQEHQIELTENVAGDISEEINNEFVSNDNNNIVFTDSNENQHELLTASGLGKAQVIEITWLELKDLRDNSQLVAGSLYRITDYNCTTTQENTQSAGHQFDIVLLALSANKLAEEGWAMMNESNIWDITFTDGVKKCYVTKGDPTYTIVLVDTLMGMEDTTLLDVDEQNKTASFNGASTNLDEEGDFYNYFQNSNLSAWKVWYCLDNDKSRFAWADDSVDESTLSKIEFLDKGNLSIAQHQASEDIPHGKTAWIIISGRGAGTLRYTDSSTPSINDSVYIQNSGWQSVGTVSSYTPAHEGTGLPNGRGVIYRLIDEFNNDVGYDFKNIQHKKHILDGLIDPDNIGTDIYVYPFNVWINESCQDASLVGNTLVNDVNGISGVCNNKILNCSAEGGDTPLEKFKVELNDSCCLSLYDGTDYYGIFDCSIDETSLNCVIQNSYSVKLKGCAGLTVNSGEHLKLIRCTGYKDTITSEIYLLNKKVLTEE